ncbi:MAG: Holliday junction branch migration protein RuvA [Anaerolineaceae bacterium]|nr:Holliday junction branch migration protein RuvA [Anaerolineaceae bacterium]
MIASLRGKVLSHSENGVTIDVNGIGFFVFTTNSVAFSAHQNDVLFLYTHMHVRETLMALYGFESIEEREFFLLLNNVNGIGPKAAMSILSTMSMDSIRHAVLSREAMLFSQVPGIGKKTAEKIMLYLKDKIPSEAGFAIGQTSDIDSAVVEALTVLGYSIVEAQSALQSIPRDVPDDIEEKLRVALQYFT